ncbi:hypothetical protein ACQ4LE_009211 [Meloidogyne hapla]
MDNGPENIYYLNQGKQFTIVPIRTDKYRAEVLSFMQSQFRVQEPITNALKCSAQDTLPFYRDICSDCFKYDLSLIAHDCQQIAGIALSGLWQRNEKKFFKSVKNKEAGQEIRNGPYLGLDNANRLAVFLEMVESELNSILKNEECVLKLEIIFVHPMFLRQGLASDLLKRSIEIARLAGCSNIITCATAVASQNLFKKFGFITVHKVLFKDFLEDGVPVFRNLHDDGSGAELMLYKLEKEEEEK